jgi:hypothetical protein
MKNQRVPIEQCRIQRLLAVGCPVPSENHTCQPLDIVVEVRNSERTQAFDFRFSTEYILDLRIRNASFALLKVQEIHCRPNWKDKNITRLGDPRLNKRDEQAYRMPSGRKIPHESVLNHRLFEMELEPGKSYEGMYLAYSIGTRISTDYLHGEGFPMRIALVDNFGRSHESFIEVRVDRTATTRAPDFTKKGTGLYGPSRAAKAAVIRGGMRQHPRPPASSTNDNTYSSELFQHRADIRGPNVEI